jgi:hypothetical protein
LRHAAHGSRIELRLGQRKAAVFLDRLSPQATVAADAGENDPDGTVIVVLGESGKERSMGRRWARSGAGLFTRKTTPSIVRVASGGIT